MNVTTEEPILVVSESGEAEVTTIDELIEESQGDAVEVIETTIDDVQDTVQEIEDTVDRIESNQHLSEDANTWLRQQITDLSTQLATAVQTISALQTTVTELLLSQNTVIQDVVLQLRDNSKSMSQSNPEPTAEQSTDQQTQAQELEILENAESVTEAIAEAVTHPVVSQAPGQQKINWI